MILHSGLLFLATLYTSKCKPMLLHGLESCALNKSDIRALDFVSNGFCMKTNDLEIVTACQKQFGLRPHSDLNSMPCSQTNKV